MTPRSKIPAFEYCFTIRLHDTDAAGRLFFGHLFRHAHDAFESFMARLDFPLDRLLRDGQPLLPLVHAEADYLLPLQHGDTVRVAVTVLEIRRRSFAMGYRFIDCRGEIAARARTVHVRIGTNDAPDDTLPQSLRAGLNGFLERETVAPTVCEAGHRK